MRFLWNILINPLTIFLYSENPIKHRIQFSSRRRKRAERCPWGGTREELKFKKDGRLNEGTKIGNFCINITPHVSAFLPTTPAPCLLGDPVLLLGTLHTSRQPEKLSPTRLKLSQLVSLCLHSGCLMTMRSSCP